MFNSDSTFKETKDLWEFDSFFYGLKQNINQNFYISSQNAPNNIQYFHELSIQKKGLNKNKFRTSKSKLTDINSIASFKAPMHCFDIMMKIMNSNMIN